MKLATNLGILLFATSLALTGCKKDNAAAPPAGSNAAAKPADQAAAPAAAAPTPAAPAAAPAPAAPAAGATFASDDDYLKTGTAMMEKMMDTFKAAGNDCDKLADDISKMTTENDATIKAAEAYEKAHPDAKKKLEDAMKDKVKAFGETLGAVATACKDNKKFQDAITKLSPE